ncbi:hypothetical protein [Marivirga sp.]|uniref:hypothetical protein n=1 Tax=Marivirga sp. TaxID=2018662 RepID=UPI003DA7401F
MRINLFLIAFLLISGCSKKAELSNGDKDMYSTNFTKWVNEHTVKNDKIAVLNYGLCHYCDNKINQVLINSNCLKNNDISFVLATDKNLPTMLDTLNQQYTNRFYHYKNYIKKPVVGEFPRIYEINDRNGKRILTFTEYSSVDFANELDHLCTIRYNKKYIMNERIYYKGMPIPGDEGFMMIDKKNGISYENIDCVDKYYLNRNEIIQ